jgi:uncharacterized protein (TIGR02246 family)
MRVFVIGAAGGIGRRLTTLLTAQGVEVTGMHRKPEQAEVITAAGGVPVRGDLTKDTVAELSAKMRGHHAVVFSAGAHGTGTEQTTAIDGRGAQSAVDAAELAGVSRFVLVSAFPESERGTSPSDEFEHYMRVKKEADTYLSRSSLDWLIIRPGLLLDDTGTGLVSAGSSIGYGQIPRDDVAGFIDAALREPAAHRQIVELTSGSTALPDAVKELAEPLVESSTRLTRENVAAVVEAYAAALSAADADALAPLFCPEATLADPIGSEPHYGRTAIREAFARRLPGPDSELSFTVGPIRGSHNAAAFEFTYTATENGITQTLNGIDVFRLTESGLIKSAISYWE